MPVMDGFEFVLEMRKRDAWRAIPIVVVTAKDITEEDRRRLDGGVVSLIERGGLDPRVAPRADPRAGERGGDAYLADDLGQDNTRSVHRKH